MDLTKPRFGLAAACTFVIAIASLMLSSPTSAASPPSSSAPGCWQTSCTFKTKPAHCGAWDTSCGCFSNANNGNGSKQQACNKAF
jgi:hypothetical protein